MTNQATDITLAELVDAMDAPVNITISPEKTFSTGSRGYTVNGRFLIHGKVYIGTLNLIESGSKPRADAPAAPAATPEVDASNPNGVQPSARRRNTNRA